MAARSSKSVLSASSSFRGLAAASSRPENLAPLAGPSRCTSRAASSSSSSGSSAAAAAASSALRPPPRRSLLSRISTPSTTPSSPRLQSFSTSTLCQRPITEQSHRQPAAGLSPVSFNQPLTPQQNIAEVQDWFKQRYPTLSLPDNVVSQAITHESWNHGLGNAGHNRRLSFIGRRALRMFLSTFLHSNIKESPSTLLPLLSSSSDLDRIMQTSRLGDSVGRFLKLEEVMRWRPALAEGQKGPKETGLFKIRGTTVEAVVGAIYHHHGAAVARAFFHSSILPQLETLSGRARSDLQAAIERESKDGQSLLSSLPSNDAIPGPV